MGHIFFTVKCYTAQIFTVNCYIIMKLQLHLSVTTRPRYETKQEKWITETTEVMLLVKLPLSCEKRPFS